MKYKTYLILGIFILWAAFFSARWAGISNNTLATNDNWLVGKRMTEIHLMGADDFLFSRSPITDNALRLSAIYGFQEVLYKRPISLSSLKFDALIEDSHALHVILAKTATSVSYLRLSRKQNYPSQFMEMDLESLVTTKTLSLPPFPQRSEWQSLSITRDGDSFNVHIDRKNYARIPAPQTTGLFGFKGDDPNRRLIIRNIKMESPQGNLSEDFSSSLPLWKPFLVSLFLLCGFGFLGLWFFPHVIVQLMMSLAFVISAFYYFDLKFWSHLEVNALTHRLEVPINMGIELSHKATLRVEEFRYKLFRWITDSDEVTPQFFESRKYPEQIYEPPILCTDDCQKLSAPDVHLIGNEKTRDELRIMYLGASQTFGEGATTLDMTFVGRHHSFLKNKYPRNNITTLNIATPGANTKAIFKNYFDTYATFHPDILYVNLSTNDRLDSFASSIKDFIRHVRPLPVILITEASSSREHLNKHHKILFEIAKEEQIPLLKLHQYLESKNHTEDALVWWDVVHLTDYGHKIVADWLNENDMIMEYVSAKTTN